MFLLKSIGSEWANKILVSSAKIIGAEVLFVILGNSFIYKRKKERKKKGKAVPLQARGAQRVPGS